MRFAGILGIIIGVVFWGCTWGFVTNKVIQNRGYYGGWFWWGFFFGLFATIIALSEPEYESDESIVVDTPYASSHNALRAGINTDGSWMCTCGRNNPGYTFNCVCGQSKAAVSHGEPKN